MNHDIGVMTITQQTDHNVDVKGAIAVELHPPIDHQLCIYRCDY